MKAARFASCVAAVAIAIGAGALPAPARAAVADATPDPSRDLARKVANPLASLISVPLQYNVDGGIGPFDVERTTLNVQPVVPISLGSRSRWRLISRTVVPIVDVEGGPFGGGVSGVGDVTQSVFVTPIAPTRGGWMLGLGPVVQMPVGSEPGLTTDRWSAGPTAIAVRQSGPWTYGVLANHLWSVGGEGGSPASNTFAQPFVNYVTRTRTTFALNTEANRDWQAEAWSIPVNAIVNQLMKLCPQPMSVFVGARYWVESPEHGPEGWGLRVGTTLLFPTGSVGGR